VGCRPNGFQGVPFTLMYEIVCPWWSSTSVLIKKSLFPNRAIFVHSFEHRRSIWFRPNDCARSHHGLPNNFQLSLYLSCRS
jgi:hypothetical protein